MEKKGDLLNQLAIITDLLEKINLDSKAISISIDLESTIFDSTFDIIQKKHGKRIDEVNNTFTITIGFIDIVFNRNSV
jgi:hypothetical protein